MCPHYCSGLSLIFTPRSHVRADTSCGSSIKTTSWSSSVACPCSTQRFDNCSLMTGLTRLRHQSSPISSIVVLSQSRRPCAFSVCARLTWRSVLRVLNFFLILQTDRSEECRRVPWPCTLRETWPARFMVFRCGSHEYALFSDKATSLCSLKQFRHFFSDSSRSDPSG